MRWRDHTGRDRTGKAMEMVQHRREIGPFVLWAREDGLWEINVEVSNGDNDVWFPPCGDADTLDKAKTAAEKALAEYVARIVRAAEVI